VQGTGIWGRFAKLLEYRHLDIILVALAVVATLPALSTGLLNDDLTQWAVLASPSQAADELSEFGIGSENSGRLGAAVAEQFAPMDPNRNLGKLREYGAIPWWTYDGLWVRFWRPLASFTHWLDYRIFGSSPVAMHAHNIIWLAAVVFLVTILYRRLNGPPWMAGLAALLFVLDDFTYFPAMWIANRNIFLSLFFGILCVLWHHRWRRSNSPKAGLISVVFLAGSLLSAEAGVATCAYLFAYAVTLEEGNWSRRAASLAPAIATTVIWRLIYNLLGHGASGGSFYLDPSREPLRYAWAMVVRGPILLMRQWSRIAADIFSLVPVSTRMILWPVVVLLLLLILVLLWPLLRSNRHARFWAIGMHLSVLPICATMPMNRNLIFVGIGACGLVGLYLGGVIANEKWLPQQRLRRFLTKAMFFTLLIVHLPFALFQRVATPFLWTPMVVNEIKRTMDVDTADGFAGKELVVVNAPNPAAFFYLPFVKAHQAKPLPRSIRVLAPAFGRLEVTRIDDNSLKVRAAFGNLLTCKPDHILDIDGVYMLEAISSVRSNGNGLRKGEKVELPGMSAEVVEVDDESLPVAVVFKFAVSLDDESLRWIEWSWKKDRYLPFEVPAVGQKAKVSGPF